MSVTILRANALDLPFADDSVDLVVTSPPYFGLRSYTDAGQHYDGQVGSEATPGEFVDALIAATREIVRVVKPTGSIFVNLGDKYASGNSGQSGLAQWSAEHARGGAHSEQPAKRRSSKVDGFPTKSLLGLPWRYALRCIDELGLTLRAEIVWSKPNGLPESVRDRVRRSHEQWFHFVQRPTYYANVDEIREPHGDRTRGKDPHGARGEHYRVGADGLMTNGLGSHPTGVDGHLGFNPLGKLPGSVWTIPTQPLRVPAELGVDHFAAFPMEWVRRFVTGWSPPGICTACGEGRRAVADVRQRRNADGSCECGTTHGSYGVVQPGRTGLGTSTWEREGRGYCAERTITGYVCACSTPDALTRPAVVLDPFGGTGTTALVADVLGRDGISVDLSADYCRLAQWRTADPAQRARAARSNTTRPKPSGESHPYSRRRTARGRDSDPAPAGREQPLTLFELDGEAS